jgi:hypothetical protein
VILTFSSAKHFVSNINGIDYYTYDLHCVNPRSDDWFLGFYQAVDDEGYSASFTISKSHIHFMMN